MIYYKNNKWYISDEEVTYKRFSRDEENKDNEYKWLNFTQEIGREGRQYWIDFENKWNDMEVIEFKDIKVTDDELQRLEEINSLNIQEGHHQVLEDYVMKGVFPELPNHILKDLEFTKIFNIILGVEE